MNIFQRKKTTFTSGSLSREAWRKFLRNKLSVAALIYILLSVLIALLGYLVTPDSTPMANRQTLELSTKKPGFSVTMLKIIKEEDVPQKGIINRMLFGQRSQYQYIPVQDYEFNNGLLTIYEYTGEDGIRGQERQINTQQSQLDDLLIKKNSCWGPISSDGICLAG